MKTLKNLNSLLINKVYLISFQNNGEISMNTLTRWGSARLQTTLTWFRLWKALYWMKLKRLTWFLTGWCQSFMGLNQRIVLPHLSFSQLSRIPLQLQKSLQEIIDIFQRSFLEVRRLKKISQKYKYFRVKRRKVKMLYRLV